MTNQLQHQNPNPIQQRRAVDIRIPAIEKYAYCLCLHVRPTTIFIAVFKLIRALLFASILLNTELKLNEEFGLAIDDKHRSTQIALHILSRLVMASVSAVAIYAVISGRAALLMPLYAMLLVDFFFALPAFYNRDLDPSFVNGFQEWKSYPDRDHYTRYSLMLFSTITMVVKIYFLCVVWKCYRYLRLIELVSPIRLSEIYPHFHQNAPPYPIVRVLGSADSTDLGGGHNVAPPPYESIASSMKPPNYDEAIKSNGMLLTTNSSITSQNSYEPRQQSQTLAYSNPTSGHQQQQNIPTQVINVSNSNVPADVRYAEAQPEPNGTRLDSAAPVSVDVNEPSLKSEHNQHKGPRATSTDDQNMSSSNHTSDRAGNSNLSVHVVINKMVDNDHSDRHDV